MTRHEPTALLKNLRAFSAFGKTGDLSFRVEQLKRLRFTIVLLFSTVIIPSCFYVHASDAVAGESTRPLTWAVPIKAQGVDNLHKIHDGLYRSAQPTEEGMKNLEKLGVKTVINLRAFHSDSDEANGTALLNNELSVKTWHIEDEDVIRVLRIISKKENGPFLIHCRHGADRTGVMSAIPRLGIP